MDVLSSLDDDVLMTVAASLTSPSDLLAFGAACRRAHGLPTDRLWRNLCEARWLSWPRYRLTAAREEWLAEHHPQLDWCMRYRVMEADAARTTLTHDDIRMLNWNFNFTATAGGRGRSTLKRARFSADKLFVPGYPPLNYSLVPLEPDGSDSGAEADGTVADSGGDGVSALDDEPDVDSLGNGALKELIASAGLSSADCLEKAELRARAREALEVRRASSPSSCHGQGGGDGAGSSAGTASGSHSGSSAGASSDSPRPAISAIRSLMSQLLSSTAAPSSAAAVHRRPPLRQVVQIANFPPHWVERLMDSREWLIYNDNVTFVSCGPDGAPGSYDERGFLTDLTLGDQ